MKPKRPSDIPRVTRRKRFGDIRYIDYLPTRYVFKVSHTYEINLIKAFLHFMPKGTVTLADPYTDRYGSTERRWWRVKATPESCFKLLEWGLKSDYRFTPRALERLNEIVEKLKQNHEHPHTHHTEGQQPDIQGSPRQT